MMQGTTNYKGDHHYLWSSFYGSPQDQQERDKQKRDISEKYLGVTLIEVRDHLRNYILITSGSLLVGSQDVKFDSHHHP